jgi:hypothetical protein
MAASMTNIQFLPGIDGSNTSFTIARNADWLDDISFVAPGSLQQPLTIQNVSFVSGSNILTNVSTNTLFPGMPISPQSGIPIGALVGAITSTTTLTMVDSNGFALNATANNTNASVTFNPVPLDLTGINFISSIRAPNDTTRIYLTVQTADGTMLNGKTNGILSYNVPSTKVGAVPSGSYLVDIIAYDTVNVVNLFPSGPASITVVDGVSTIGLVVIAPNVPIT